MIEPTLLGPWVRRFLFEYMVGERNLSVNTRTSYRDMLVLLLPYVAARVKKPVDRLAVTDLSPAVARQFLTHLEEGRHCSTVTRNQRLGALRTLARFIGEHAPEHVAWCAQIRLIPFKKTAHPSITYLSKPEMDALLAAPDQRTLQGQRDYALLLFLYNSGARASEAVALKIGDVDWHARSVRLMGKGNKQRTCPLWATTAEHVYRIAGRRGQEERLFLNRNGLPMTRFGIHTLVERCSLRAVAQAPSLAAKRVSPHVIRHTTATHLLRAGVDINTIRAWLGHVSVNTTNIYAQSDLETKARALATCAPDPGGNMAKPWQCKPGLMNFLRGL